MNFTTTQLVTVSIICPDKARIFEITATDGVWNSCTTKTGTSDLWKVLKNKQMIAYRAEFAAAIGVIRVRNTGTQLVKFHGLADQLGETRTREITQRITFEENDVLEFYCDVA